MEIYNDWDASRVDMAQSILRSKGIESVVSDIPAKVYFGKRLNMHIMVAPSEAHRAKEIHIIILTNRHIHDIFLI